MITVLSMSPAIDKRLVLNGFRVGGTNRARVAQVDGAGKGVDVALALAALSEPVLCVGVLAGNGGIVTDRLARNGVPYRFVDVPGVVRTNLKLLDEQSGVITEVNEPVAAVPEARLSEAADAAVAAAAESRYLVLSGSLPEGCPADFYADMIRRVRAEAPGCRVLLDADGERLRLGVRAAPFLVKPNRAELEESAGERLDSREALVRAARALLALGPELVVASLGGEGALAVSRGEAYFAPALAVDIITTTGAGDAMVGGLLHGFLKAGTLAEALRHGVAAATSRCAYAGDRFLDAALHEAYRKAVKIEKM